MGFMDSEELKYKLSKNYGNILVEIENPLVAIIVTDMIEYNLLNRNLNQPVWKNHETFDDLYGEYWLYAYEAYRRGWISTQEKYINGCTFYKALETFNVYFYDNNRQIEINDFEEFEDELLLKMHKKVQELQVKIAEIKPSDPEVNTTKNIFEDLSEALDLIYSDTDY